MLGGYTLINKTKSRLWQAKHILLCKHCIGSDRCQHYAMYCNVISTTKRGNLKIEVFGERLKLKNDFPRTRYVVPRRVRLYADYFKD